MISIVTPVLNGARFIEKNIQSIQELTTPFEHIIVDGGSTDGTIDIIKKYPHVKLLYQKENTGMYGAIHQGFESANFNFITWVNCDDTIITNNYECFVLKAVANDFDFYYSNALIIEEENDRLKIKKRYARIFPRYLLKNGVFPFVQPATLYKKSIYFEIGGLRFKTFKVSGDRDLFQRMAFSHKIKFKYIPIFTVKFLIRKDSLLHTSKEIVFKERKYMTKTNHSFFNRLLVHLSNPIRTLQIKTRA